MKKLLPFWTKYAARFDAMTQRERIMVYGAVLASIGFLFLTAYLTPAMNKQKLLITQMRQNENQVAGMEMEIQAKAEAFGRDPDEANKKRLTKILADTATLTANLRAVQKGVVAPDKMSALLERMLKANGRLQLVSLRTLPTTNLMEEAERQSHTADKPAPEAPKDLSKDAPKPAASTVSLLYRHGVELTVRGSYLDMIAYMAALEKFQSQLFWGQAKLDVEETGKARLSLTVYTLSLDKNWMKL